MLISCKALRKIIASNRIRQKTVSRQKSHSGPQPIALPAAAINMQVPDGGNGPCRSAARGDHPSIADMKLNRA
jgi:hypothetical protein